MKISIPELALVVLIGPSGAGKSTFARTHFKPTEILSSDYCRALVSDDENDQSVTNDAFDLLHYIAGKRLRNRRLVVVDATNVKPQDRKPLVELARRYHVLPVAIVLNLPPRLCHERNHARPERRFGFGVVQRHSQELRRSLRGLSREGFRYIYTLHSPEEVAAVTIERTRLWTDLRHEHGPFDIIGDVHGCCDELEALLERLGYVDTQVASDEPLTYRRLFSHPQGRRALFLGDLVDRGPRILDTVQLVRNMVMAGHAFCVPGNHDVKLVKKLKGRNVNTAHGLQLTLDEFAALPEDLRASLTPLLVDFLDGLVSHFVLDDDKLVVAHAGMKEEMQGRASGEVREFALYGETTGETDEYGLPVRYNWAAEYRGEALVIYGHTPVPHAEWLNRTLNIDTGCVFGGSLTALRYPELQLVSVSAAAEYAEPARPLGAADMRSAQHRQDDVLDIADVMGKRIISTRLMANVTVEAGHSAAALEIMSRFALDPKWLIYLPPTMSPCETSRHEGYLEYPTEAFSYYRKAGVHQVICEEKHMGSRAVVMVCRDEASSVSRFGVVDPRLGVCYTRTGRPFFNDTELERAMLVRLHSALTQSGFWEKLQTDWVCLDCELMPWSVKAQELLVQQYAPVGVAGEVALAQVSTALDKARQRGLPVEELVERWADRQTYLTDYRDAYRGYCWTVDDVDDLRLAPFHILATEGAVHADRDHHWHMTTISAFTEAGAPLLQRTDYRLVDLDDPESEAAATAWWETLTGGGGEGMVVKPLSFVAEDRRGLVQPAVKCRGRDYLRIIYGPEYSEAGTLATLRRRGLGRKRGLAAREFALGVEALERFARREPLYRVHECVFGVLALESEPVDPRL